MLSHVARQQAGQATLEAALVLPILLLVVVGMVGLGIRMHISNVTLVAASRAARVGAVAYGDSTLTVAEREARVEGAARSMLSNISNVVCYIEIFPEMDDLSVRITCRKSLPLPWIGSALGSNLVESSHLVTFRIEPQ